MCVHRGRAGGVYPQDAEGVSGLLLRKACPFQDTGASSSTCVPFPFQVVRDTSWASHFPLLSPGLCLECTHCPSVYLSCTTSPGWCHLLVTLCICLPSSPEYKWISLSSVLCLLFYRCPIQWILSHKGTASLRRSQLMNSPLSGSQIWWINTLSNKWKLLPKW